MIPITLRSIISIEENEPNTAQILAGYTMHADEIPEEGFVTCKYKRNGKWHAVIRKVSNIEQGHNPNAINIKEV